MTWFGCTLLIAAGYWETLPPPDWSEQQLQSIFRESPWAHDRPIRAYLASASVMQAAEDEVRRRRRPADDPLLEDYRAWLAVNAATHVVLAVRVPRPQLLDDAAESKAIERESKLIAHGKKYPARLTFPPTRTDPWLRIAFERPKGDLGKEIDFELYIPGSEAVYPVVTFTGRDLIWKGKPDF